MTIPILQIFVLIFQVVQSDASQGLGLDILIYVVMSVGFMIIGFLVSNFYNKARVQEMETEVDSEKERLSRRINTLEKEVKHLYAKDDEQIIIINNLKKQLQSSQKSDPGSKDKQGESEDPLDLFAGPSGED